MSVDPANRYVQGDLVTITGRFRNPVTQALIQPTSVVFKVIDPDGNVTTPTAQFNANLATPDGVTGPGYFAEIDTTPGPAGTWYYRAVSTGTGQAAEQARFFVEAATIP